MAKKCRTQSLRVSRNDLLKWNNSPGGQDADSQYLDLIKLSSSDPGQNSVFILKKKKAGTHQATVETAIA